MKIDMHCHVREGSIDSKVPIEEFIKSCSLKALAECWLQIMTPIMDIGTGRIRSKGENTKDFVVLKGIEYDTLDADTF